MTWGEVQFSYWINILFLKAPSNATREQSGEDDCGHIREGDGGKGIVVQLWQREHGPLAERDKHLGEVEEEEHDGDGDAQNAPAQDHVHCQIIFRPATKAQHKIDCVHSSKIPQDRIRPLFPFFNIVYLSLSAST